MKEERKIKGLKSQLKLAEGEAEALKIEVSNKQKEYHNKLNHIKALKSEVEKYEEDNTIQITEHAILRYLERVKDMNISEIEKEILTDEVIKLVEKLGGNGNYPNGEFKLVMKNYKVTTII